MLCRYICILQFATWMFLNGDLTPSTYLNLSAKILWTVLQEYSWKRFDEGATKTKVQYPRLSVYTEVFCSYRVFLQLNLCFIFYPGLFDWLVSLLHLNPKHRIKFWLFTFITAGWYWVLWIYWHQNRIDCLLKYLDDLLSN